MNSPSPRRRPQNPILSTLPRTESVENEIRELSARVRVLLELLNVCRLADSRRDPARSPSRSAKG